MIFETERCCGCRTCEMACSYHHKGVFETSISSIKILDTKDKLGFAISLVGGDNGGRIACDLCMGLSEPFCVKYCGESDELRKILNKFSQNR